MVDTERLHKMLVKLDDSEKQAALFDAVRAEGDLAWAIDRFAERIIRARQMRQLVHPLLVVYEEHPEEFIERVKAQQAYAINRLLRLHGRSNSTSIFQNAINQFEAAAMSEFVDMLEYHELD